GTVSIANEMGRPTLLVGGELRFLRRRVIDFLKREAKHDLEWAVVRHTMAAGVRASSVRLRNQTCRWGSCAVSGLLSFSWRLIMTQPFVLDNLAAHEVANLSEINHSSRFWAIYEALCPEHERAREWLSANGSA